MGGAPNRRSPHFRTIATSPTGFLPKPVAILLPLGSTPLSVLIRRPSPLLPYAPNSLDRLYAVLMITCRRCSDYLRPTSDIIPMQVAGYEYGYAYAYIYICIYMCMCVFAVALVNRHYIRDGNV